MPTPIELALTSLLPTATYLPAEVVTLATSVLAQSRSKAASLKPEEEIGRTYACCQIACERLRNSLALDVSKPTPPCKPRVYAKLLTYLQSALSTAPSTPKGTRVGPRGGTATPQGIKNTVAAQDETPSRRKKTLAVHETPASSSRKRKAAQLNEQGSHAEEYMPVIRGVCKNLGEPKAAPHVLVGVERVASLPELGQDVADSAAAKPPSSRRKRARVQDGEKTQTASSSTLLALVVVLSLLTTARMSGSEGDATDARRCGSSIDAAISSALESPTLAANVPEKATLQHRVDEILEHSTEVYTNMEWFENVPAWNDNNDRTSNHVDDDDNDRAMGMRQQKTPLRRKEKHGKKSLDDNEDPGAAGLLPGMGTMFQPALDWLDEERQEEYARWKAKLLRQIAVIEQTA